jgi:hypothetical protein
MPLGDPRSAGVAGYGGLYAYRRDLHRARLPEFLEPSSRSLGRYLRRELERLRAAPTDVAHEEVETFATPNHR